ncbi:MAG: hydrogenase nickel incorporation protein HypB [Abditibacteriota bacterium]|nr:hydrogenase nickel incorporation protein HypB [Abditibacteriota bacterium]
MTKQILKKDILGENTLRAEENRRMFADAGLFVVNVCGGPGAGKTTLISSLCSLLGPAVPVGVVEGDVALDIDTERLRDAGIKAVQINTMGGCHLTALQVCRGVSDLGMENGIVFIENIGNLVCPASFDLGEACRIVVTGVPEGADKPYKYITMFRSAHIAVLSKNDLSGAFGFDTEYFERGLRAVMPVCEWYKTSRDAATAKPLADRLLGARAEWSAGE